MDRKQVDLERIENRVAAVEVMQEGDPPTCVRCECSRFEKPLEEVGRDFSTVSYSCKACVYRTQRFTRTYVTRQRSIANFEANQLRRFRQ